jgi:hypothetical protein
LCIRSFLVYARGERSPTSARRPRHCGCSDSSLEEWECESAGTCSDAMYDNNQYECEDNGFSWSSAGNTMQELSIPAPSIPEATGINLVLTNSGAMGTMDYDASLDSFDFTDIGLGESSTTLDVDTETIVRIDINPDQNRVLDLSFFAPGEEDIAFMFSQDFGLLLTNTWEGVRAFFPERENCEGEMDAGLPNFLLDDLLEIQFEGSSPELQIQNVLEDIQIGMAYGSMTISSPYASSLAKGNASMVPKSHKSMTCSVESTVQAVSAATNMVPAAIPCISGSGNVKNMAIHGLGHPLTTKRIASPLPIVATPWNIVWPAMARPYQMLPMNMSVRMQAPVPSIKASRTKAGVNQKGNAATQHTHGNGTATNMVEHAVTVASQRDRLAKAKANLGLRQPFGHTAVGQNQTMCGLQKWPLPKPSVNRTDTATTAATSIKRPVWMTVIIGTATMSGGRWPRKPALSATIPKRSDVSSH